MCGANPCDKPNCTWSIAYLQACEARWVMRQPAEWRANYYQLVEKHRGKKALDELKGRVKFEWSRAQESKTKPQQGALL